MTFSCVWNVNVYRGDGERGHSRTRLPRQARSGVDVYQLRSGPLAPLIHSSCSSPLTGQALSLLATIYSDGICLCHTDVNVYP